MDQNSAAELHQQVLSLSSAISSSGGGLTASIQRLTRDLESTARSLVKDATSFTDAHAQNERITNRAFDRNLQNVNDNSKRISLAMRTLESSLKNNTLGTSLQESAKMLAQSSQLAMNEFHAQVSAASKSIAGLPNEFSNVYQQLTGLQTKLASAADFEALDDYVAMQRKLIVMQQAYTDNIEKVSHGMIQADAGVRHKYLDNIQAFVELSKEHNVNFLQFIREDDVVFKEKIATSLAQNKKLASVLSDAEIDKLAQAFDSTALLQNHAKIIEGTNAVAVALQNHALSAKNMLKEAAVKRMAAESALVGSIVSVQKDMREIGHVRPETIHAGMMAGASTIFKGVSDILKSAQTLMIGPAAVAMQTSIDPARIAAGKMGLSAEQLQLAIASNIDVARKMAGGQEEYARAMKAGYNSYIQLAGGNPELAAKMQQQQLRFIDLTTTGNVSETQRNKLMLEHAHDLKTLRDITKMSTVELSNWQAGLLQDSEFRDSLMTMNDKQRANLSNTMNASVGLFTSLNFTADAATKLTEQFIKLRGSTTAKTRYQQAAKLVAAGSMAGMTPQQLHQMYSLYVNRKQDSPEFQKLANILATRQGEMKSTDNFMTENVADQITKLVPDSMAGVMKQMAQNAMLEGAPGKQSSAGAEAGKALAENEKNKLSGASINLGSQDALTKLWTTIGGDVQGIKKLVETFGGSIKGLGEMIAGGAQIILLTQIAANTAGMSGIKGLLSGGGGGAAGAASAAGGVLGKAGLVGTAAAVGWAIGDQINERWGTERDKDGNVISTWGTQFYDWLHEDEEKKLTAPTVIKPKQPKLPTDTMPGDLNKAAKVEEKKISAPITIKPEQPKLPTDTMPGDLNKVANVKQQTSPLPVNPLPAEVPAPIAIKQKTPALPINPAQATPDSFAAEVIREKQKQTAARMSEQQTASDKKEPIGSTPPDPTSLQMLIALKTLNKNFENYAQYYRDIEADKVKMSTLDNDRTKKPEARQ